MIVVYGILYVLQQFFRGMFALSHAVTCGHVAEQAAPFFASDSGTRNRNAIMFDNIDVEKSSQGMVFLNAAGEAFGFKVGQRGEDV